MTETPERNGEALNWLLEGATDSARGFRQGASLARNPKLQSLFTDRAGQREDLAGRIAEEVRSFAQTPSERSTVIGAAHQAFTALRDSLSQDSDKALVEELLRRERALARKFQSAIDDPGIPPRARSVAAGAMPAFVQTAEELAALDRRFTSGVAEGSAAPGHYDLTDDDNRFLEAPAGAALLFSGAGGAESVIQRARDAVVRIGVQSVAVATSEGGSLAVTIEAGGASAKGADGPAPMERRLAARQTLEVLVKGGAPTPFRVSVVPEGAAPLRTIVWSLDVQGEALSADAGAGPSAPQAGQSPAAEDLGRAPPL